MVSNPTIPPGAIAKTPVAAAMKTAGDSDDEDGVLKELQQEQEQEQLEQEAGGGGGRVRADPLWCPPGTADRLRKLKSPLVRLHSEVGLYTSLIQFTHGL